MTTKTQTKHRVTLSLTPETVRVLDAEAQGGSRSAALAHVLNEWQSREARQKRKTEDLEAATAAYYAAQSDAEQAEDNEWATFAGHTAALTPFEE